MEKTRSNNNGATKNKLFIIYWELVIYFETQAHYYNPHVYILFLEERLNRKKLAHVIAL